MGGGGGGKSGGGSKAPAPAPAPVAEPVPNLTQQDPETKAVRDAEMKKIRRRRGAAGTVLTTPLGGGAVSAGGPTLLGRMG